MDERAQVISLYRESLADVPRGRDMYGGRHNSLRFLAWLLDGWPDGLGPQVAREMLRRWLFGDQEFASFHLASEWAGKGSVETYAIGRHSFGSVQVFHTSSRGASNTRSST
jgi:hypothetical protein